MTKNFAQKIDSLSWEKAMQRVAKVYGFRVAIKSRNDPWKTLMTLNSIFTEIES